MSDYNVYSRLSTGQLAVLMGPGVSRDQHTGALTDDKSVNAFSGDGKSAQTVVVARSTHEHLTSTALDTLSAGAAQGDDDSIGLLINLATKQDNIGKRAENILFDLFSGKRTDDKGATIPPGIGDEIARQSIQLYKLTTPTLSVNPSPRSGSRVTATGVGETKDMASASSSSSSHSTPTAFSAPTKLLSMAGAGAELEAKEARGAFASRNKELKDAESWRDKAEPRTDGKAASRDLIDAGRQVDAALRRLVDAHEANEMARERLARIGDVFTKDKAPVCLGLGASLELWSHSRLISSSEIDVAIEAEQHSAPKPEHSAPKPADIWVASARGMDSLNPGGIIEQLNVRPHLPVFVPLNTGKHWVSLVFYQDQTDKQTKAVFFSSAEGYFHGRKLANGRLEEGIGAKLLKAFASVTDDFTVIEERLQQNASNGCGVFTVEAFRRVSAGVQSHADPVNALHAFVDAFKAKDGDGQARFNIDGRRRLFGAVIDTLPPPIPPLPDDD